MVFDAIKIPLPEYVVEALNVLESAGYEAWCVGGCVRDALIGRDVNDYDIATIALWQQTEEAFEKAGYRTHETTGIKHGTLTVIVAETTLEITTYRIDGTYSDSRHPDNVQFVRSIEQDLARRDFTINALAYHPERGLLDCFGGYDDLNARTIRAVGTARERFKEDALRILRGCRFASQLGFDIHPETLQAMKSCKSFLANVSVERITHELQEFLLGQYVHDALLLCADIIPAVLPEIAAMKGFEQHTPYHMFDVLEHTAYVVQRVPAYPLARWAALFHDSGKPAAFFLDGERGHFYGHAKQSMWLARGALSRLCLSQSFVDDVVKLVELHDVVIQPTARSVKRALAKLDGRVDLFRALCELKRADAMAQTELAIPRIELAEQLQATLETLLDSKEAFTLAQLAINGNDIIALGVEPGRRIGALLDSVLDAVIEESVANERETLLEFVRELI